MFWMCFSNLHFIALPCSPLKFFRGSLVVYVGIHSRSSIIAIGGMETEPLYWYKHVCSSIHSCPIESICTDHTSELHTIPCLNVLFMWMVSEHQDSELEINLTSIWKKPCKTIKRGYTDVLLLQDFYFCIFC